jgi:hypothetical protein
MERRSGKGVDEDLRREVQIVSIVCESHAIDPEEVIRIIRHTLSPTLRWRSQRNQRVHSRSPGRQWHHEVDDTRQVMILSMQLMRYCWYDKGFPIRSVALAEAAIVPSQLSARPFIVISGPRRMPHVSGDIACKPVQT